MLLVTLSKSYQNIRAKIVASRELWSLFTPIENSSTYMYVI